MPPRVAGRSAPGADTIGCKGGWNHRPPLWGERARRTPCVPTPRMLPSRARNERPSLLASAVALAATVARKPDDSCTPRRRCRAQTCPTSRTLRLRSTATRAFSPGRSVIDLSLSGPPPPGSEGQGPPKQKTKTSRYVGRYMAVTRSIRHITAPQAKFLRREHSKSHFTTVLGCPSTVSGLLRGSILRTLVLDPT